MMTNEELMEELIASINSLANKVDLLDTSITELTSAIEDNHSEGNSTTAITEAIRHAKDEIVNEISCVTSAIELNS